MKANGILLVVAVMALGTYFLSTVNAQARGAGGEPVRWQVVQGEFGMHGEKYPILIDTETGQTWEQRRDNNGGYVWNKMEYVD